MSMTEEEYAARHTTIKVIDRRRFSADGAPRDNAAVPDRAKPAISTAAQKAATDARERSRQPAGQPKRVDFLPFVASLATNAMAAMGALPQARERGMPVDPQMAREYIDIICMLQERTAGNLTPEEDTSLQRLIAELQRAYQEATGASGAGGAGSIGAGPLGAIAGG
jgi:hypothetical protein